MSGALAFAALLLGTALWLLLPFLPALRELLHPTDADPLTMVGQDSGDLTVFAQGFRTYLERQLPPTLAVAAEGSVGTLADGTPFVALEGRPEPLAAIASREGTVDRIVLTTAPIELPGGETFRLEVCARAPFVGGPDAAYRALLAEREARLGVRSSVLRWVHAEGDLEIGDNSWLAGRASANGLLRLGAHVTFGRIRAAHITVGAAVPEAPAPLPAAPATSSWAPPGTAGRKTGPRRVEGDLTIPAGATFAGSLVVTGALRVGAGAHIVGSLKAHGPITLEAGALVDGSVVSRQSVHVAASRITGPLIAEAAVHLGAGSIVGLPSHPATVTAPAITIEETGQVFGALAAREQGITVPASAPRVVRG